METHELQKLIGDWGDETFWSEASRVSRTVLHFIEEALELANVPKDKIKIIQEMVKPYVNNSPDPVEAADCTMLLLHIAHILKFDLEEEVLKKFEECKKRQWAKPDKDGVIKHVEE